MAEIAEATADFNEARGASLGHIYFIGGDEGPIKIGYSGKLFQRLRALKNSSPVPVRLLAATPGSRAAERRYHERFAEYRLHGEWFDRVPDILKEIARISKE
ncbi:GIY-YIG nuclease family protein [Sphingomonas sp. H39-1-10]|uniref:GIY-YIG nuclease family protein n=1 Tax=Sphingomonas pollutisoli TaxID=3030829 RepID=UPI0023BA2087|nr:GIY-YIG nuclease family protein [Sphingomonas pollutisoli]MDF0490028.1 GIY-YIG nuclease family protein [Sphingomonas pollutisoli]